MAQGPSSSLVDTHAPAPPRWRASPWLPAAVVLVIAIAFVGVRLERAAHGDISRFVVAGDRFVDTERVPHNLFVDRGDGYDGQFAYRLSLDPLELADSARGITFDVPIRRERIAYPLLAFGLSAGHDPLIPFALVAVNVIALAALAAAGGALARDSGRDVLWGIPMACYFGFAFSLSRDLNEIVEAALLLGALFALRRRRYRLGSLAFLGAVLAREAAVIVVVAYAGWRLSRLVRRRARLGAPDAAWIVPLGGLLAWQAYCLTAGPLAIANTGGDGLVAPGWGIAAAVGDWIDQLGSGSGVLLVAEAATLLLLVTLALVGLPATTAPPYERLAFVLVVVAALLLPVGSWTESYDFRVFSDLALLSWVVLLGTRLRLLLLMPATAVGVCWLGAAALRVGTI